MTMTTRKGIGKTGTVTTTTTTMEMMMPGPCRRHMPPAGGRRLRAQPLARVVAIVMARELRLARGRGRVPRTREGSRIVRSASCGQKGHWRGDPSCPKVQSGEVEPRDGGAGSGALFNESQAVPAERAASPVKRFATPTSPSATSEEGLKVSRVNWTYMVNSEGWNLLDGYNSGDSSDPDRGESRAAPARSAEPRRKKAQKCKVSLQAILAALGGDVEDAEMLAKLERLQEKIEKRAKDKEPRRMEVEPHEILAILPHLGKGEKKQLLRQLQAGQDEEAVMQAMAASSASMKRDDHRRSYGVPERGRGSTSGTTGGASSGGGGDPDAVVAAKDLPAPVRKKRVEEFRRSLYENALDRRGQLRLSDASDVPRGAQEVCPHRYEDLQWGANASAEWANCRGCKLRKVLYYSSLHGALMEGAEPCLDGLIILDTGCRTAVAGKEWHDTYCRLLRGLQCRVTEHEEVFRFGAGQPVLSTEARIYPIELGSQRSWLRLAVVESPKDRRVQSWSGRRSWPGGICAWTLLSSSSPWAKGRGRT